MRDPVPDSMILSNAPQLMSRILKKSEISGECIVWTGANDRGYGLIKVGGRTGRYRLVHRIAWISRHGLLPAETPHVLHRCDNPPCFRDEHLFLGTQADNTADMVSKGRQRGPTSTVCKRNHSKPPGQRCHECQREARLERRLDPVKHEHDLAVGRRNAKRRYSAMSPEERHSHILAQSESRRRKKLP